MYLEQYTLIINKLDKVINSTASRIKKSNLKLYQNKELFRKISNFYHFQYISSQDNYSRKRYLYLKKYNNMDFCNVKIIPSKNII